MIIKGLLEQEITKDVIEYKMLCSLYLAKSDEQVISAIIDKLYSLIYDAEIYVRIFEDLDTEDKKLLLSELDKYFIKIEPLKDKRTFNIANVDSIFWSIMNYLNAKTKDDFDRILAKVKNREEE